jgi:A/G-specific adenine glycosylase
MYHLDQKRTAYFRKRVKEWFAENGRELPWRETTDPYLLLVAEFLLQQTDVEKAAKAYEDLSTKYPTVNHLARAKIRSLERIFDGIGLRYRAGRLSQSAKFISRKWGGMIPNNPAELMQLPGVGRYMANAVCSAAFGKRLTVVDVNVARILHRFFGFSSRKTRARDDPVVWEAAQELMPRRGSPPAEWNWALLDFAGTICTARQPRCSECPVAARCVFYQETLRGKNEKG